MAGRTARHGQRAGEPEWPTGAHRVPSEGVRQNVNECGDGVQDQQPSSCPRQALVDAVQSPPGGLVQLNVPFDHVPQVDQTLAQDGKRRRQ